MTTTWDAWNYRSSAARRPESGSLVGYHVHASDGDIGKIDETSDEVGTSRVVVDTGPWIFGLKVVLPAGTIERVDDDDRTVYVDLTKDHHEFSRAGSVHDGRRRLPGPPRKLLRRVLPVTAPPVMVELPGRTDRAHLEISPVGDAAWRVSDSSVPDEDVRHVVAFVEAHEADVEVVWLRGTTSPGHFENLDSALEAIDDIIATGEVRDPFADWGARRP